MPTRTCLANMPAKLGSLTRSRILLEASLVVAYDLIVTTTAPAIFAFRFFTSVTLNTHGLSQISIADLNPSNTRSCSCLKNDGVIPGPLNISLLVSAKCVFLLTECFSSMLTSSLSSRKGSARTTETGGFRFFSSSTLLEAQPAWFIAMISFAACWVVMMTPASELSGGMSGIFKFKQAEIMRSK